MVGRIIAQDSPQGCPRLNSWTLCRCCFHGKENFAGEIKVMDPEMGDLRIIQMSANKLHDSFKAKNLSQLCSEKDVIISEGLERHFIFKKTKISFIYEELLTLLKLQASFLHDYRLRDLVIPVFKKYILKLITETNPYREETAFSWFVMYSC